MLPPAVALLIGLGSMGAHAFNCGPNTLTYKATLTDGSSNGIRCVKYTPMGSDYAGAPFYEFQWYGEGVDAAGLPYRSIGVVEIPFPEGPFSANDIRASATSIFSSGAPYTGTAIRTITPVVTEFGAAPSVIRLTGGMTQTWRLVQNTAYTPLPLPTVCGSSYTTTYEVRRPSGSNPSPTVSGLRCVFVRPYVSVWLGVQDGVLQLGTAVSNGISPLGHAGAAPLCDASIGRTCGNYPFGSLTASPMADPRNYHVLGGLDEYWMIPGTYRAPPPPPPPTPAPNPCTARPWLRVCQ